MKNIFLIIIIIFLIFIIYLLSSSKIIDRFDNTDVYTKQSCCNEKNIKYCESWGKTAVCNFNGDKSCMCLDAF